MDGQSMIDQYHSVTEATRIESRWLRVIIGGFSGLTGAIVADLLAESTIQRYVVVFLGTAMCFALLASTINYLSR